ncbi:MAG: hypothetical protein HDT26_13640 [Subdoligranulum sp.]|nr:hypothetical protein [Subdoligranulum sp.]MBD5095286.1 hypothetical protein [Subdoligranulum sp.]
MNGTMPISHFCVPLRRKAALHRLHPTAAAGLQQELPPGKTAEPFEGAFVGTGRRTIAFKTERCYNKAQDPPGPFALRRGMGFDEAESKT